MDEEGEEKKESSSSSDEEVQRNKPPSPLLQSPATSKKQSKKSGRSKVSKFLSESEIVLSGPGLPLPDTSDSSSLNVLRERVKQNNMIDPLPIRVIECPPMYPHTGKQPLEVRAVIEQHVHNLKFKMQKKPNAIVLPLLVLVDRQQCPTKHSWNKDPRVAIKEIPLDFEKFLSRCCLERRRKQQPQSFEITPSLSLYVPDNVNESPSHWCVHEGRVEEMSTFVTPRSYTLVIADAPHGFCAPNFVNDDVKYGVSAYKKVIEAFEKVITCDSWSLVFFHAHDQITATQKAFTNSNMTCQMLTWIKPNIHGYKLDCLSWASLKELPNEFQEVGMKSMASDPCFFDASQEPQPPIGSEKVGEIVDLVDFEPDNVEVEEQASDTPPQITSMGEKTRNEEEEDLPIQA
ncbi:hypothetical protein L7F22_064915 [Adiantum nelumboides]|nr:hypothetical protein [Adiantum nelumboides]